MVELAFIVINFVLTGLWFPHRVALPKKAPPMPRSMSQSMPALVDVDQPAAVDIRHIFRVLWAGKWAVALTTFLAVLMAGYYGFTIARPQHAAVTIIEIRTTQTLAMPDQTSAPLPPGTQMQILLATPILEQVITQLDLQDDPAFNRYLTPVPPLSPRGLRTTLRNLLQGRSEPVPDAAAIASKLVQNLRAAIRVENPRDSDLLRVTVTTGDPDRAMAIANTLAAVYLADQVARKQDATAASMALLGARSDDLRRHQTAIEAAITDLVARAGLHDPTRPDRLDHDLQDTTARLASAQAALARASDTANTQRLTAQIAALQASRADLAAALQALTAASHARDRMQRDLDTAIAQQAGYQQDLRALTLGAAQITPDSRVLNAATEARYIGPQKLLMVQIAAMVGGLGGLMLVALRHSLRRGFTDAAALQDATGLPVLAQLPLLPSRRPARLLAALDVSTASAATEGYRHLRTTLMLHGTKPPQVILSTSAIPGEGKTTQAIGLAHALALLGKRVLLVDADLRRGAFRHYFALAGTDGLAAVILGHIGLGAATEPSPIPGVDLLAGGAQHAAGGETLFAPALADVVTQARAAYDVVIIDAPPVVPVADAVVLARQCDAVILAVRWDKTPASVVLAAAQKLAAAGVPVTGVTLTQIDIRKQAQRGGVGFAHYGRGYFHA